MNHDKLGNLTGPGLDSGFYLKTRWTDIETSATSTRRGALSKPDFDFARLGLLFPQDDPSEKVYITAQMRHEKKFDTQIFLHVHFYQETVELPIFKADYRFYNNGTVPPAFTTIDTSLSSPAFTYPGSGEFLQIIGFPAIDAPLNENVSALIDIIFYRDDNIVTGDVLTKFIDMHYEKDSAGSLSPFSKY